jgi:hypothetical protein
MDAADANDDGRLDIAHPVATLQVLILDGKPLPPPGGSGDVDPTPGGAFFFLPPRPPASS